jgi:membrane dipeptidase
MRGRSRENQEKNVNPRRSSLLPPPDDYNFIHPPSLPCGDGDPDLSYNVPLSPQQEARAMDVYRRSFVILSHTHCVEPWDFEEMREAGITVAIVKLDIDGVNMLNGARSETLPGEDWFARGMREIPRINELVAQPDNNIRVVRTMADLYRAKREGKVGIILGFEGARPLAGKLENVKLYYDLGMRELQPWFALPNESKTADQLLFSDFGVAVLAEMDRLGILFDAELLTGQAFAQALSMAKKPMIISHCAVQEVYVKTAAGDESYQGTDMLNDVTIRAIAKNGGTMGMHFWTPDYIRPRHGTEKATLEDLVDHIAYIRDLVGSGHVSLGVDFFPERGWQLVQGAGRISQIPNVAREMVRREFDNEEISKILGGNLMRVFKANWGAE